MKHFTSAAHVSTQKNRNWRAFLRPRQVQRRSLLLEVLETRAVFNADPGLCFGPAPASPAPAADEVHVVFAPGTPAEVMAAYEDLEHQEGFDLFSFGDTNRWNRTATNGSGLTQGDSTTIRWSVVTDGTAIAGYNGEPAAPSNLRSFLAGIYGTNASSTRAQDQPWFVPLQQVFDRWSAVSGVNYVYEPADDGAPLGSSFNGLVGVRGDVRLSGHYIDGPNGILAYNFYPTVGDMVLDTGDTFFNNTGGNSLRLRNTIAHEAGHGLGLGHVSPTNGTKLMEPSISLGFDGPQADDILAVNRGYGDRLEKNGGNNTPATASSLGTGATFSIDTVSIDDDSDVDWFRFTVGAGASISATLTPTGSIYTSNGTTFNSLAQSNLALAIYGNGGNTLIASANLNGAGVAESISSLNLPGSGTYYVRVTGSANAAQMYRLTGSISSVVTGAPEIAVLHGTSDIVDGTGSVSFGSVAVGAVVAKTFTIQNTGSANLTLGSTVSVPTGFVLTQAPTLTTLAPGVSTTFIVSLDTSIAGSFSGAISFTNNDADENPFNFNVSGLVTAAPPVTAPEIAVFDGTTEILDNTGNVSFGSVVVGGVSSKTFTIRNLGTANLTLQSIVFPNAAYTLTAGPSLTVLPPGAATTLTVSLSSATVGTFGGTLSLINNDADESSFDFTVSGSVTAAPPAPLTQFTDNFNRSSGTSLGSNWTERSGNFSISANTLVNSVSGTSVALVNGVTVTDVILTADVNLAFGSKARDMGLVARHNNIGSGSEYWGGLVYSSGRYYAQIWESINGSWTLLSSTQVSSGNALLRFEVIGTSLKLYVNNVLRNSVIDSTLSSGFVGVSAKNTGPRLDNFTAVKPAGFITAAAAPTTSLIVTRIVAPSASTVYSPQWIALVDHLLARWSWQQGKHDR